MNYQGFDAYEKSINRKGPTTVFIAKVDGVDFIIVQGKNPGFKGEKLPGGKLKAPLNHKNAEVLRKVFPFTAPSSVLGNERSFGVGDRLGIATPGHIKVFEKYDACPVFAQQSIRELKLTNRSYEEVFDAASFSVFREGFKKPWGADGDHLKTEKDIKYALSLGFTMITLDCSEHIKNDVTSENALPLPKQVAEKYLGKEFDVGEGLRLTFTEEELKKMAAVYGEAIAFATAIYKKFFGKSKGKVDSWRGVHTFCTPSRASFRAGLLI